MHIYALINFPLLYRASCIGPPPPPPFKAILVVTIWPLYYQE